jgi:hypothetical protein
MVQKATQTLRVLIEDKKDTQTVYKADQTLPMKSGVAAFALPTNGEGVTFVNTDCMVPTPQFLQLYLNH